MSRRAGFGAIDGAALVVASVVGAGIFTVPAYVARLAGTPGLTLGLWVAGGLLALAGALSYAELATRFPRGGAEYVYLREAFGDWAGFLSGWTSFVAGFSGAIAAAAVGFATHLSSVLPQYALPSTRIGSESIAIAVNGTTLVALLTIAVFTAVSAAGVRASRIATNALAALVLIGIAVVAIAGGLHPPMQQAATMAPTAAAISALVPIFFTYSGWNAAAYVAGEFRDPTRNVPRALVGGTLAVTLLYVGLNAALLRSLSASGVASASTPVGDSARATLGGAGGGWVTMVVLVALASSVCALVVTGPRIYAEMARDGALPPLFASARNGRGAPVVSVVAQSVWSGVLVLTGTFEQIVSYTGFAVLLFSGAAVAALIVLRRRDGAPTGYAVPGYPYVPIAFLIAIALIAVSSFRYAPGPSLVGVALIALGAGARSVGRLMRG